MPKVQQPAGRVGNPLDIANEIGSIKKRKEEFYAVASRDYGRARAFADKWGYKKAYGVL